MEVTTWITSGVLTVGLVAGVEEVFPWGGYHDSDVR